MANTRHMTPPPINPPGWKKGMGAVVKPQDFKGTLRRLWGFTKDQRIELLGMLLLSIVASAVTMSIPYLVGKTIDTIQSGQIELVLLGALGSCYLADYVIRFVQSYGMAAISQRMIRYMRIVLFKQFNQLPVAFFDKNIKGDLMSRLTNDIDNISTTVSDSLTHLMQITFTIVGILCMMWTLNSMLTGVTVVAAFLVLGMTRIVTKHTRVLFRQQQKILGQLNGHVEESISGIIAVKAYSREDEVIAEFAEINDELCDVGTKAMIWSGFLMPLMNVINNLCFISISIIGGYLGVKGVVTVGVISSFLLYARQFTRPLTDIANIYNTLQTAIAGAERLFEILDQPQESKDEEDAQSIQTTAGAITLENVSFGYDEEHMILNHIDLEIKSGARVAIVGSTGAGKTTIISLLTRFYDVTQGAILLDGKDIRRYKRADLRSCFGVVLQDAALLRLSIMENIRYGKQEATDEEVIEAARKANVHQMIQRLPEGYQTIIGENGNTLSQGEKQLLTIARAILADAPIMILDEATSCVDTRTEKKIKEGIQTLTQGRTSIIIAHRLSTIRDCDIVVLEKGIVVERGSHEELLEKQSVYAEMHRNSMA